MASAIGAFAETCTSWCSSSSPERDHEKLTAFLAHGTARVGAVSSDGLLDRVERGNALERFAGDWRVAAFGNVEKPAPQMGPTEREHNRFTRFGAGNGLVGGIAIALHDAAITLQQFEGVDRAAPGSVAIGNGRRVGPASRPVITGDSPEIALFGAAATGIKDRR